jgi:hypothetical protein
MRYVGSDSAGCNLHYQAWYAFDRLKLVKLSSMDSSQFGSLHNVRYVTLPAKVIFDILRAGLCFQQLCPAATCSAPKLP